MSETAKTDWKQYLNRRMLALVFLGFSSGLPYFILANLVQAWLATAGVDIKKIGLFAFVMFPFAWKFLWAPLLDRIQISGLGRRRGWMVVTQALLLIAIGIMGRLDPHNDIGLIVVVTLAVSFLSASQDIVIDAYRREILHDDEQGLGGAVFVNSYKVANLVPGALSLILASLMPWQSVFWVTAAFMLPGLVCTLLVKEPTSYGAPPKDLVEAVVLPFREFIARGGWGNALWILGFVLMYRIGDSMAGALLTKFFIDLGFPIEKIGIIAKTTVFWSSIAGGIVGGIWMVKLGINRALWVFGVLQALTSLGFAGLAQVGPIDVYLAAAMAFEGFAIGLGTTAITAYIARSTDRRYSATQFALFTSLAAVPRTFITASVGYIVAETGWFMFFIICFLLAIPGMLMLPKIAPWNEKSS